MLPRLIRGSSCFSSQWNPIRKVYVRFRKQRVASLTDNWLCAFQITLELQPTPASNSMQTINEGSAEILCKQGHVFYNPVQQFNRDLSISVISTYNRLFRAGESKGETGAEGVAWKPGVKSEVRFQVFYILISCLLNIMYYL